MKKLILVGIVISSFLLNAQEPATFPPRDIILETIQEHPYLASFLTTELITQAGLTIFAADLIAQVGTGRLFPRNITQTAACVGVWYITHKLIQTLLDKHEDAKKNPGKVTV